MPSVGVVPNDFFPTALALPYLPLKVDAYDVSCDRLFQHRLATSRPTTINLEFVPSRLPSVPLLGVRIDARLVTSDP